ncbi:MAG: hypothetical protein ACRECV_15290 [Xanthobacteraceae bacterium]
MPKPATKRIALTTTALVSTVFVSLGTIALAGRAQAQGASPPDISGSYHCKPNPDPCTWPGSSPSITQSDNKLQIKGDNGAIADATLTSATTISAAATFNSLGIIRPDHSIDWSDGTTWRK